MSQNINRVTIAGNLTRDAELSATSGGTSVLRFGVAVNESRKNQQTGQWDEYANFIDCALFGKRADALRPYLTKGAKVCVAGRLRQSRWQDKQTGQARSRVEVVADDVELMGGRQPAPTYQQQPAYPTTPGGYPTPTAQQVAAYAQPQQADAYGEEIPFD